MGNLDEGPKVRQQNTGWVAFRVGLILSYLVKYF